MVKSLPGPPTNLVKPSGNVVCQFSTVENITGSVHVD